MFTVLAVYVVDFVRLPNSDIRILFPPPLPTAHVAAALDMYLLPAFCRYYGAERSTSSLYLSTLHFFFMIVGLCV